MVEIKKIKIRKQLYRFEVRKRFQYTKRYTVKERTPLEKIIHQFSLTRSRKKEGMVFQPSIAAPKGGKILTYVLIFAAILLIAGAAIFLIVQGARSNITVATRATISPEITLEILKSGVITNGPQENPASSAYVQVAYSMKDISAFNASLWTYSASVPSEVYLLKSHMDKGQTTTYHDFKNALEKELGTQKISVNELSMEQLETIPKGAAIIIPSGFIPQELIESNSSSNIAKLINRGVVLIYMGYPFDYMITKEGASSSVPTSMKSGIPFDFLKSTKLYPVGISIEPPYYEVKGKGQNYETYQIYGVISVVRKGEGAILFVPQSLDAGWKKEGAMAAKDISKIILTSAWVVPDYQQAAKYVMASAPENRTVYEFFTFPFYGNKRYVKLQISGIDLNGDLIGETKILDVRKETNGNLYVQGGNSVISSKISGEETNMIADLKEPKPREEMLYLSLTQGGIDVVQDVPILQNPVSLQVASPFYARIDAEEGEYVASIVDSEGQKYAQAYLRVIPIVITKKPEMKERETFVFEFTKDGKPIELSDVSVKVKSKSGQDFGTYTVPRTSKPIINISSSIIGENKLPYGKYDFIFKIGDYTKTVEVNLQAPENVFFSPPFLISGGIAVVVLVIGYYLRGKEKVKYQLDVPDFPATAKTKIPVKTDAVLGIFDKVNDEYKWKSTPLTAQEVKNGFRRMFFEGRPIYISDYNVEFIMDKLEHRKQVVQVLDYYAPVSWEEKTGKSIRYLCIFRRLRDIFVNNAVPFSMIGEEENCDTKIDLMGQEMFLHIYDKRGDMKRLVGNILSTSSKGITLVLFKDNDEKGDFMDVLASPSQASAVLKMEVESNVVQLLDLNGLESMIKEMKNV
jgi:hypothetical protein